MSTNQLVKKSYEKYNENSFKRSLQRCDASKYFPNTSLIWDAQFSFNSIDQYLYP